MNDEQFDELVKLLKSIKERLGCAVACLAVAAAALVYLIM